MQATLHDGCDTHFPDKPALHTRQSIVCTIGPERVSAMSAPLQLPSKLVLYRRETTPTTGPSSLSSPSAFCAPACVVVSAPAPFAAGRIAACSPLRLTTNKPFLGVSDARASQLRAAALARSSLDANSGAIGSMHATVCPPGDSSARAADRSDSFIGRMYNCGCAIAGTGPPVRRASGYHSAHARRVAKHRCKEGGCVSA